ncbi:MAG: type B 50S ribosomal protein L31 [Bdellovibrionales bacterium]|nr:type B 50S ribosomal protein L31 [Bdellovibrionales bacterium]
MKKDIHPEYKEVLFYDMVAGTKFLSRSTKVPAETMKHDDGKEYPVIRVDISSDSHPFYTGQNRIVDTEGRVERFKKRYASKKGSK